MNSEGVINSLSGVDYIFTPIAADRVVLESSLSFAVAIHKLLVKNEACRLKGLHLFWNMVDGREKTDLYTPYEQTIGEPELPLMKVFIPDTKRFKKELTHSVNRVPFHAVPGGQTAGKGQQHGRTDNRNRIPYKIVTIWQS